LFTRIGADDPEFNLRSEPAIILRRSDDRHLFASVIEPHGYFNEAAEISRRARPRIENIEVIGHDDVASVVRIESGDTSWTVVVNNGLSTSREREVEFDGVTFSLSGNFSVYRSDSQ
jgi:hypothetical protein